LVNHDARARFGVHRPAPTKRDLAAALDDLLAGRAVATPRTEAVGCKISRAGKTDENAAVNYSKHVARILRDRCVACHREGEIAPFSLASYKEASGWAEMIDEVVQGGRMPPWHASPEYGKFANDCRLTDEEKRTIATWVVAGAPEGDPKELPEPAHYVDGWRSPAPNLVISPPKTVEVPAEGTMPYHNFSIDPKLKEGVWVRASQVRPGNPSVVHHLVVFVIRSPDPPKCLTDRTPSFGVSLAGTNTSESRFCDERGRPVGRASRRGRETRAERHVVAA
jgi:hypothetical protein